MEIINIESPPIQDLFKAVDRIESTLEGLVMEVARKEYATSREMAKELGVSLTTLRVYREEGMPHSRIGKKVFFLRREVAEYLKQHLVETF